MLCLGLFIQGTNGYGVLNEQYLGQREQESYEEVWVLAFFASFIPKKNNCVDHDSSDEIKSKF